MRVRPWRSGSPAARPVVPLPPDPMPPFRGGRPLKRWRYVACFDENVMVCAAVAHVGPLPVSWWAVWDRRQRTLAERTVRRRGLVRLGGARVRVEDGPVALDLRVGEGAAVETVSPHGAQYAWTRKQGGVRVQGSVTVGERRHEVDARGIVDDSAGYHARHTSWRWSAGVGVSAGGDDVAWNLVSGLHDGAEASERTVWVGGEPHHVAPVRFEGLDAIRFGEGGRLEFEAEATRSHTESLLLMSSAYEQPFGSFAGDLPGAGRLRSGLGVMELHDVRW